MGAVPPPVGVGSHVGMAPRPTLAGHGGSSKKKTKKCGAEGDGVGTLPRACADEPFFTTSPPGAPSPGVAWVDMWNDIDL